MEKTNEINKRIDFLVKDLEKRRKLIEKEINQLSKLYYELTELKAKAELNEQNNSS